MDFHIPTTEEIVAKYGDFNPEPEDKRAELEKMKKEELIELVLKTMSRQRTDTIQALAKAILKDPDFVAASYEDIAEAIKTIKPEAKTSAKSIASYVSKKREEWELPQRIRVTKPHS